MHIRGSGANTVSTITPLTVRLSTLTVRVALAAFLGAVTAVAILAGYTTTDAVPDGFALPAGIIGPIPPTIAPHVAAVALPDPRYLVSESGHRNAPPITIGQLHATNPLQRLSSSSATR